MPHSWGVQVWQWFNRQWAELGEGFRWPRELTKKAMKRDEIRGERIEMHKWFCPQAGFFHDVSYLLKWTYYFFCAWDHVFGCQRLLPNQNLWQTQILSLKFYKPDSRNLSFSEAFEFGGYCDITDADYPASSTLPPSNPILCCIHWPSEVDTVAGEKRKL